MKREWVVHYFGGFYDFLSVLLIFKPRHQSS